MNNLQKSVPAGSKILRCHARLLDFLTVNLEVCHRGSHAPLKSPFNLFSCKLHIDYLLCCDFSPLHIYSFHVFIKVPLIYQFQSELYEQDPFSVLSPEVIKRYQLYIPCEENLCRNSCLFPFVNLPLSSLSIMEMSNLCQFLQAYIQSESTVSHHFMSYETEDNQQLIVQFQEHHCPLLRSFRQIHSETLFSLSCDS